MFSERQELCFITYMFPKKDRMRRLYTLPLLALFASYRMILPEAHAGCNDIYTASEAFSRAAQKQQIIAKNYDRFNELWHFYHRVNPESGIDQVVMFPRVTPVNE